jgi:hypothetical protein
MALQQLSSNEVLKNILELVFKVEKLDNSPGALGTTRFQERKNHKN